MRLEFEGGVLAFASLSYFHWQLFWVNLAMNQMNQVIEP